ncbi:MAG TPA: heme-binding domain-containing protein [Verrucomicrobia bacterium]|nr:heme-binding domain-containing protein [Verrucomicrobiota bacterium]HOB31435.1 heme-binding domain-containing protein [Verrucomicrobiota bacterium]HOP97333.1 heme-binding domain-containing protein [Verrucomicrobiota bacterium]HPU54814.1 heme-binding domain-containing protein [Verrucomicrobiota bacterium]
MKKRAKWFLGGAAVCGAAALLINPTLSNPPVAPGSDFMAAHTPPPEIAEMIRNSCYDCHSHETRWPWYSRVAPVSWWLVDHVNDGREELNFSNWPRDDARRAAKMLRGIRDEVEYGTMPLPSYTWGHPKARLTQAQREQLAAWADEEASRISPPNRE